MRIWSCEEVAVRASAGRLATASPAWGRERVCWLALWECVGRAGDMEAHGNLFNGWPGIRPIMETVRRGCRERAFCCGGVHSSVLRGGMRCQDAARVRGAR